MYKVFGSVFSVTTELIIVPITPEVAPLNVFPTKSDKVAEPVKLVNFTAV
jgi:hypothetical protein